MPAHTPEQPLTPELEAIAAAAHDRLQAHAGEDLSAIDQAARRVADAASAAIRTEAALSAIAEAERIGEQRCRNELRADILRRVERAAKRKREADSDYQQAIDRAARLGLSHREIAAAAQVTHGTVRAVLTRTDANGTTAQPSAHARSDGDANEEPEAQPIAV